jgi:hypothetical protein
MARYRMRVRTPRPVPETFAYMADVTNFRQWDPGTKKVEQVTGAGPGPGATYDVTVGGTTLRYEVERYDPPALVRLRGRTKMLTSVDTITVTPDAEGSVVSYDADLTLNGAFRFADPVLGLVFRRMGDKAADGLVKELRGLRLS